MDEKHKVGTYNFIFRTTSDLKSGMVFRYPRVLYNKRLILPPQNICFASFE